MVSNILNIREQCIQAVDLLSQIFVDYDEGVGNDSLYMCYMDSDELDYDFCWMKDFDERVCRWLGNTMLMKKSWYVFVYLGETGMKVLIISTERRRDGIMKGYYCDFNYATGVGHSCELLRGVWGSRCCWNMRSGFDFILEWSWNNLFARHLSANYFYAGRRKLDALFDKGREG